MFHNLIPLVEIPTYSVHVDACAHTTFHNTALSREVSSLIHDNPMSEHRQLYPWQKVFDIFTATPIFFDFFWEPLGVWRSFSRPAAITLFDRLFGPLPSMELFHAKIQFSQTLHLWAHLARCASMSLSSIFGSLKGHSP
jgi:hypothetical protein